jgi:hypothetical protein
MGIKGKLAIDAVALLAYLAVTNTLLTGIPVHEWLSIALTVLLAVHVALNWDWTIKVVTRFFKQLFTLPRFNLIVDLVLLYAFAGTMLTGLMVSRVVVPTLGLTVPFGPTWRILHSVSAKLLLLATGLHVGLHWRWVVNAVRALLPSNPPEPAADGSEA